MYTFAALHGHSKTGEKVVDKVVNIARFGKRIDISSYYNSSLIGSGLSGYNIGIIDTNNLIVMIHAAVMEVKFYSKILNLFELLNQSCKNYYTIATTSVMKSVY